MCYNISIAYLIKYRRKYMSIGELFIELGFVGDTRELEKLDKN